MKWTFFTCFFVEGLIIFKSSHLQHGNIVECILFASCSIISFYNGVNFTFYYFLKGNLGDANPTLSNPCHMITFCDYKQMDSDGGSYIMELISSWVEIKGF